MRDGRHSLHLGVTDIPSAGQSLLFGMQQALLCISGLLVYPFLISEIACAGESRVELRVQLIAATFVTCGIATVIQTTFGLRLSILHGPAIAFLPPLLAYHQQNPCKTAADGVSDTQYHQVLQEISGSLFIACISFIVIGASGLAGVLSRLIGPITITPLMILLASSIVPTMEAKMSMHWVSILMLVCVVIMAVYLEEFRVHIPYFSISKRKIKYAKVRLFGQFPYLLSISLVWFICYLMTITGFEPEGGEARTDKNITVQVLVQSPWFRIPMPGAFGGFRLDTGLCIGFVASCFAAVIENLGSYDILARVSQQKKPPTHSINRAVMVEGIGSMTAAVMGVCTGVTTYSENIALIHITRVASRRTMQVAGVILCLLGVFTKCAALLACIPEALVGGILTMGISMVAGVSLSNLQLVDLKLTRNLAIMGLSLVLGILVPLHIERNPIRTGYDNFDSVMNMLLQIRMLTGGMVAVFMDNTVPGATARQRGLYSLEEEHSEEFMEQKDGYALPDCVNWLLEKAPLLTYLPFLPSKEIEKKLPSSQFGSSDISSATK